MCQRRCWKKRVNYIFDRLDDCDSGHWSEVDTSKGDTYRFDGGALVEVWGERTVDQKFANGQQFAREILLLTWTRVTIGDIFVFGRSSNTVRLINWQTRKFGTEAQTFSVLTLLWRKGVCLSWGPATGEKEHNDWTEGKLYRCFMWLRWSDSSLIRWLPVSSYQVTPWYQIWFELWYFWYMSLNQIKDTILNLIQDLPLANPIVQAYIWISIWVQIL